MIIQHWSHRAIAVAATAVVVALIIGSILTSQAMGYAAAQSNPASVDVADKECSFWLDPDNDGEGNERFDPGSATYIIQQTPVVGGCTFKLKVKESATLIAESELQDWEAKVTMERAPGQGNTFTIHPGRDEILGVQGSMSVSVNLRGITPRSIESRGPSDNYHHEVQIPERFRLLEVMVTTPAGERDRLEENAYSASAAYIYVRKQIANSTAPENIVHLSEAFLEEGYPEIAERVISLEVNAQIQVNWWKWAAIGTWGLFGMVVLTALMVATRSRGRSGTPPPGEDF